MPIASPTRCIDRDERTGRRSRSSPARCRRPAATRSSRSRAATGAPKTTTRPHARRLRQGSAGAATRPAGHRRSVARQEREPADERADRGDRRTRRSRPASHRARVPAGRPPRPRRASRRRSRRRTTPVASAGRDDARSLTTIDISAPAVPIASPSPRVVATTAIGPGTAARSRPNATIPATQIASVRRAPKRAAMTGPSGREEPMHRTGIVVSRPTTAWITPSSVWICGSSGPSPTSCGRSASVTMNRAPRTASGSGRARRGERAGTSPGQGTRSRVGARRPRPGCGRRASPGTALGPTARQQLGDRLVRAVLDGDTDRHADRARADRPKVELADRRPTRSAIVDRDPAGRACAGGRRTPRPPNRAGTSPSRTAPAIAPPTARRTVVAGVVAVAVVDPLEVVDVDHQDADRVVDPATAGEQGAELVEVAPVRQTGQGIGRGPDLGASIRLDPVERGRRLDRRALEDAPRRRRPRIVAASGEDDRADRSTRRRRAPRPACSSAPARRRPAPRACRDDRWVATGVADRDRRPAAGPSRCGSRRSRPGQRGLEDSGSSGRMRTTTTWSAPVPAAEVGDDRVDDLVDGGRSRQPLEDPGEVLGLRAAGRPPAARRSAGG